MTGMNTLKDIPKGVMNLKEETSINNIKGFILCPICEAKELVEEGTSGKSSHKCNCGRYIEYDFDSMTARVIKPVRGATRGKTIVNSRRTIRND